MSCQYCPLNVVRMQYIQVRVAIQWVQHFRRIIISLWDMLQLNSHRRPYRTRNTSWTVETVSNWMVLRHRRSAKTLAYRWQQTVPSRAVIQRVWASVNLNSRYYFVHFFYVKFFFSECLRVNFITNNTLFVYMSVCFFFSISVGCWKWCRSVAVWFVRELLWRWNECRKFQYS